MRSLTSDVRVRKSARLGNAFRIQTERPLTLMGWAQEVRSSKG